MTMRYDDIEAIQSPVERVEAAEKEIPVANRDLFRIRRDAVREMRATMSLGEVAKALRKTRSRVQQLESESGTGQEYRPAKTGDMKG